MEEEEQITREEEEKKTSGCFLVLMKHQKSPLILTFLHHFGLMYYCW